MVIIGKRYLLREPLGRGGMGTVYRAADLLNGQLVALKQVNPSTDPNMTRIYIGGGTTAADYRLVLAQEFQLLASLRHPNIISVLDYGFDDQMQPYYTMDLLQEALPLPEAAQGQSMEVKVNLLLQLLQGLAYLHRRGILHRDLKPANVLVRRSDDGTLQVKILDFGLAVFNPQINSEVAQAAAPVDGAIAGTLAYLAPEILAGETPTAASDLYAVGVMAYEIFAGEHPYDCTDVMALIRDIIHTSADIAKIQGSVELQVLIERLLLKRPASRFERAADVIEVLGVATGQRGDDAAVRESYLQAAQLVGRDAELNLLMSSLKPLVKPGSSTQETPPTAWLIAGESGVGKTRLVEELRTRALVRGALVLRGQNIIEGGQPYVMWRDALRWLALQSTPADDEAAVLQMIVPDLSNLLDRALPPMPDLAPEQVGARLSEVAGRMFRAVQQPLMLIAEDLQWAGDESLTLLRALVASTDGNVLIVGTYRDDERPDLPQFLPQMQVMRLGRLNVEAIVALSAAMLGPAGRMGPVIDLLRRESEGNAFFMVEVARALVEEAGGLSNIGVRTLPVSVFAGGIRKVMRRRWKRVADEDRPLLLAAAVAGRELDLKVLDTILDSIRRIAPTTPLNLEAWLARCAERAVLAVQHERWQFIHDKMREFLLDTLEAHQRRELHEQIANAIEAVYPDDLSHARALAYHWDAAGDSAKSAYYATHAAAKALRSGAMVQAKLLFEQAVGALLSLPESPQHHALLSEAVQTLDHVSLYFGGADYAALLGRAINAAEALDAPERLARVLGAAGTFHYLRGQINDGLSYFGRSMQIAERLGIEELLVLPYNHLGRAVMVSGDLPRAIGLLMRGIALAEQFGRMELLEGSLAWYAYALALQGQRDAAAQPLERALSLAQASGEARRITLTRLMQGTIDYHLGRLDDALATLEALLPLARELGSDAQYANLLGTLGSVLLLRGDVARAAGYLDQAIALAQAVKAVIGLPDFLARRAEIDLLTGRPDEALAQANEALRLAEQTRQHGIKVLVLRVLGKIHARHGDPKEAERLLRESIAISERGGAETFVAAGQLELGRLYAQYGELEAAREALELALALSERIGMTDYARWAREALAQR